jgi:hypothetical protein
LLTLEAGHSFYPLPAYASASAGFNQRSEGLVPPSAQTR